MTDVAVEDRQRGKPYRVAARCATKLRSGPGAANSPWRCWRLPGLGSAADAADLYRIQGVPVDASAESGVAARELAIANGQREGLTRLMRRLTSPAAHDRLPDVSTVPIERYVNSFEIAEEKVGPNQYLGVINVSYIAAQVQGLLGSAGIPYVTRRSDPILVVPVTVAGGVAEALGRDEPMAQCVVRGDRGRDDRGRGVAAGRSRRHRRGAARHRC